MGTIHTHEQGHDAAAGDGTALVDMKLEVIVVPVSDVDRAKHFYTGLGWRLDADIASGDELRIVQLTPPGSGCSIQFGTGVTAAEPGSLQSTYLVVSDIRAARAELIAHGAEVGEVVDEAQGGSRFEPVADGRAEGAAADNGTYASFWLLQEITARLPGRVDADTTYTSVRELETALTRAAAAHGEHEQRTGQADANWPDWYAEYMVREQAGQELPT